MKAFFNEKRPTKIESYSAHQGKIKIVGGLVCNKYVSFELYADIARIWLFIKDERYCSDTMFALWGEWLNSVPRHVLERYISSLTIKSNDMFIVLWRTSTKQFI